MKYSINIYRDKALHSISFIGLFSLMMLTACSSETTEETVPDPVEDLTPIAFRSGLANDEEVTRSEGLETVLPEGSKKFKVWAYKNMSVDDNNTANDPSDDSYGDVQTVMPGYTVNYGANTAMTTTSNTNNWEYVNQQASGDTEQTIKYWDWSAKAYRFFGYAGEGVTVAPSSPASTPSEVSLSFTANAAERIQTLTNPQADPVTYPSCPYYSKLWFSTGEYPLYADKQFGAPVQLLFLMPYVRVRFLFTQSAPDDVNFFKKEISFAPTDPDTKIATGGTFTVTYPLTGTETKESWGVSVTGLVTIDELTQDDDVDSETPVLDDGMWYIVLPAHAADQGSYTLSVKISGETRTVVVPQEFMDWQPGYEYTYIFKITDAGGVVLDGVVPGFSPWTTVIKDRDIYNW